jgi:hypothetical protein
VRTVLSRDPWKVLCIWIAVVAIGWALALIFLPVKANSAVPYGGCWEAWPRYVHTEGAQDCRDRQWVIRGHLIVSPNGRAKTDLRPCRQEDSNFCYWNATRRGNGVGRGFVTAHRFRWYVDTINGKLASTNLLYRYDRKWRDA